MNAQRYLLRLALVVLLLTVAMAALNYYADPYGVWRYGLPGDPIRSRPAIRNQERMHKAHAVRFADADCLILGSSRVIVGLDPNHPALPEKTYNLGLSAANIYECYRYLQHAVAFKKPKMVLFAIDKGMFDADSRPEVDFDEARLAVAADGTPQPRWHYADIPKTLLSLDALVDSLKTLRDKTGVKYKDGMRDEVLMMPYFQPAKVFVENENWRRGRKFTWSLASDALLLERESEQGGANTQRAAFHDIIDLCAVHKIELQVFTNPVHAEMLDVEYGDGTNFEKWYRWLMHALQMPPRGQTVRPQPYKLEFRNFYRFAAENSEPFPKPGDKVNTMKFYWEISHYRKSIGDQLLTEILSGEKPPKPSNERAEADLQKLREQRAIWKATR